MNEQREQGAPRGAFFYVIVCVLVILAVACVALAIHLFARVLPEANRQWQATPTPTAAYGNVMLVTRDPAQPTALPALHSGDAGERVVRLQARLAELGYYSGEIDGQFGAGTADAVQRFQREHGLAADGYAGESTEARLYGSQVYTAAPVTAANTPTPAPVAVQNAPALTGVLRSGSSGEAVKALQTQLIALGYLSGTADGKYGPATQNAVKVFQQVNGLTADGQVGQLTWDALFSATVQPKPTPIPMEELGTSVARPYVRADGLPLVVNKKIALPQGYQPLQLVDMSTYCDPAVVTVKYAGTQAEREAVDALQVMLSAAVADGVGNWQISAAYRSLEYQQKLMDDKVNELIKQNGLSRSKAQQAARQTVADPGASEHHLGTCFDVTVPGKTFKGTKQHQWLAEHCWEYGFILRYTKEKRSITGFSAEAWHYRWVGQPHAEIMHRENLCLEEYVDKYGTNAEVAR